MVEDKFHYYGGYMKKIISLLMMTAFLASFAAGCTNIPEESSDVSSEESIAASSMPAEESHAESSPASDFAEFENEDGSLTVAYRGTDETVVIPAEIDGKPVTEIGRQAFMQNDAVVKVVIPDSVIRIADEAFNYCTKLQSVVLSANLKEIEMSAFKNCIALSDVTLPDSLESIGESAFSNCTSLKHINIPKSIKRWEGGAFFLSGIETVELEEGLETIGAGTFAGTNLKEVVLPSTMKTLESRAFNDCYELESVTLNNGLETVETYAFGECKKLKEIVIPASVRSITDRAFSKCTKLERVIFQGNAPDEFISPLSASYYVSFLVCHYADAEGFTSPVWNGYKTAVISKDHQTVNAPELPVYEDLEYYEQDGSITIFKYHGNASKVVIPSSIEGVPVTEIGYRAFAVNETMTSIHIPNTVTSIGMRAFDYCTALKSVSLSQNLKSIGDEAFSLCESLVSVTLPSGLERIGTDAFSNCQNLTRVNIPKSVVEWGRGSFSFTAIETLELEEGLQTISEAAFYGIPLKQLVLPSSIKTISDRAFYNCDKLESVVLNDGLETIGVNAFGWNYSLTEIIIPATVVNMTEFSFEGCRQMVAMKFEGNAPADYAVDPEELINKIDFTVYYHEGAEGFTSPVWNGHPTELW